MSSCFARLALLITAWAIGGPPIARAEAPSPASAPTSGPASAPTTAPAGAGMIPYIDSAFGFEMQLPAGWDYDRSRFQQYKDSIGLLRGRSPGGRLGLQIQVFRIQPRVVRPKAGEAESLQLPSFEDWIIEFGKALGENSGAERLEWETWTVPPRAGAVLTYGTKIAATRTRTHCLCLPFDPTTVWVFVYGGSVETEVDERQLRQDFDHLASTLRVHYDPGEAEQLAAALERGKALIDRLHAQASKVRIEDLEYYYDLAIGGKSIGYVRRRTSREDYVFSAPGAKFRDTREGLRVRERSWRFADDGTVRYTRLDMFSSFDMQNELIENQLVQLPAPDVQPQKPLIKTDSVIRKDDVLVSSLTTNLDTTLPQPSQPLSVGPVYLDLAWVRLLPGLLLSSGPAPQAVAIYNTDTRALVTQWLTPLGERKLEGHDGPVYGFEVREGLIDRPSLMLTDDKGNLLRLTAGDLVVRRVTKDEIERTYGARRDEVKKRFQISED